MKNTKKMKFKDIKKNVNDFMKYVGVGLFTLNSVLLTFISIVCYCYAIASVCSKFNINGSMSSGSVALSILLIVLIFALILVVGGTGVYFLTKTIISQINNLSKDEIFFYYFGKRWITGLICLILGFATLFGLSRLYDLYLPFYNNAFSILISTSWFICSAINFGYFFYSMIWLKRQPAQYKEKYMAVINQLKATKQTKKYIKNDSEIVINSVEDSIDNKEEPTKEDALDDSKQQETQTNNDISNETNDSINEDENKGE